MASELEQKKQILEDSWQKLLEQIEVCNKENRPYRPMGRPFTDRLQRCILQSDLDSFAIAAEFECSFGYIRRIRLTSNRRRLGC